MTSDFLIVGCGSAGAVLAARLSEDAARRVLVLEAGPDYASRARMPADLLDSRDLAGLAHDWGYAAAPVDGRSIPYRRGKVTGGTGAINAAAAQWGRPEDFDAWVRLGCTDWSWERVVPYYRKLEADAAGPAAWHGTDGPIAISRYADDELIPIQRGFRDACLQTGFGAVQDHNAAGGSGVGPWPMNRAGTTRISSALGHLEHARTRPNLSIRPHAVATRVLFDAQRATGVELTDGTQVHGRHIVLCSGAIGSPAILLRSGIGPAAELQRLGVQVLRDAPGVGARLWDHPSVPVYLRPRPGQCAPGRDPRLQVLARCTSTASPEVDDLQLVMTTHLDISGVPALRQAAGVPVVAALRAALMLPRGSGRLRLDSTDAAAPPRIELNFLADAGDRRRLREATRIAWALVRSPPLARETEGAVALDDEIVAADDRLDAYMREQIGTYCHALGTAPMGPPDDGGAVVDEHCRVRGVRGLWVADASVMPAVPRVVPHLSVMMIAERVAEWLRRADDGGTT